jgi:3-oxoacyl-[acyl-carrier protein] reductase
MSGALQGRVAIVTGGGWNIGAGIARRFVAEGAQVVVASRNAEHLARIEGAVPVVADLTRWADAERMAAATLERFGRVDVLAAIAGGGGGWQAVDEIDPAQWDAIVRQNLLTAFHSVRAVLPAMRRQDSGSILTCAGGGSFFPMLGWHGTAYACSKTAICRFTDQLTAELLDTRIRVNCIEPGQVWNEVELAAIEKEEERTGEPHPGRQTNRSPEEAAELAVWLVSDASRPLRGRVVSVGDAWWRDPAKVAQVEQSVHLYRVHRHYLP